MRHLVLLTALQLVACDGSPGPTDAGSADSGPADAGGADAGPADAGGTDAGAPPERIELTLTLVTYEPEQPIEGVEICELDAVPVNCATSSEAGVVVLSLPRETDVYLIADPPDPLRGFVYAIHTGTADLGRGASLGVFTEAQDQTYLAAIGGLTSGTGFASLYASRLTIDDGYEGATVAVRSPSGTMSGYVDAEGTAVDPSATATTIAGVAAVNLIPEGRLEVAITDASGAPCPPRFGGFETAGTDGLGLRVLDALETRIDLRCGL